MHRLQLLKPELHGIRNRLVFQTCLRAARPTLIETILLVDCRERTARGTHACGERVRYIHQAFLGECGRTVGNEAVALHLAHAQTTITGTALARLAGEGYNGTAATRMALVNHHVLQALVMRGPDEDFYLHLLARLAIIHDLVAVRVHPKIRHVNLEILDPEVGVGRAIAQITCLNAHAAVHRLQQLRDRHA